MVQRTREHVRRLDSMNYRRMHNFLMGASSEDDDTKEENEGTFVHVIREPDCSSSPYKNLLCLQTYF